MQGVSKRKVWAVTEDPCGHGFSASTVSAATQQLDGERERVMIGLSARSAPKACCLSLIRDVAVEQHAEWMDGSRYLSMEPLREARKPSNAPQAASRQEAVELRPSPLTRFHKSLDPPSHQPIHSPLQNLTDTTAEKPSTAA